jgi:hypothetical protein
MLYAQAVPGVTVPNFVKSELTNYIDFIQNSTSGGSGYTSPTYLVNESKTGGLLAEMAFAGYNGTSSGAGDLSDRAGALAYLNANWTNFANGWNGNFNHPYAMWSIYKGLELQIGLNDTTAITNLLTDCGASRGGQDAGDSCNWWEDYSEWLVQNQNADGSWTGYSYWPSVLSTPWFINILAATEIPNGGGPFQKTLTSGPDADSDGDIDLVVEVGQTQTTAYDFTLSYNNPDGPPVLILDTAPAEWQVTFVNGNEVVNGFLGPISDDSGGTGTVVVFPANKKPNNKSSTKIDWTPDPAVGGSIVVDMETRGPKKNGKFAPTSCGPLYLNSGPATVTDIATSEVLFEAGPLCLAAVEDLNGGGLVRDGSGDEDGDGFSDLDEACVLGTDPCVFDGDGDQDGLPDSVDNCPDIANPDQEDTDEDGLGDPCDRCPNDPLNQCI